MVISSHRHDFKLLKWTLDPIAGESPDTGLFSLAVKGVRQGTDIHQEPLWLELVIDIPCHNYFTIQSPISAEKFDTIKSMQAVTGNHRHIVTLGVISRHLMVCVVLIMALLNVGLANALTTSAAAHHHTDFSPDPDAVGSSLEIKTKTPKYSNDIDLPPVTGHDIQGHDLHEDSENDPMLFNSPVKYEDPRSTTSNFPDQGLGAAHVRPLLRPPIK